MNAHDSFHRHHPARRGRRALAAVRLLAAAWVDRLVARWLERCAARAEAAQGRYKNNRHSVAGFGIGAGLVVPAPHWGDSP